MYLFSIWQKKKIKDGSLISQEKLFSKIDFTQ